MLDSYPRVAIVSANPIRSDQPNGILMRSLWNGWPKDRLTQVFFPAIALYEPDWSTCGDYRRIRFWGKAQRLSDSGPSVEDGRRPTAHHASLAARINSHPELLRWLRSGVEAWGAHVAPMRRALRRQLQEIRPDCVYALLGNYWLTRVTTDVCRELDLPLYLHVTDDFAGPLYANSPLRRWLSAASTRALEGAVAHSIGRAGISPVMANEYQRRYGKPWDWFTTLLDSGAYRPEVRPPSGPFRIVYAGGLNLGRDGVLQILAQTLQTVSERLKRDIVLDIYGERKFKPVEGPRLEDHPRVRMQGWTDPRKLPEIFQSADLLVHVEASDPATAAYTRWSFSTKLSQYMMAGRPILGVGPSDIGSMEMIRLTRSGLTVEETDGGLTEGVSELVADAAAREAYGVHGRQWAEQWFDAVEGRRRFWRRISEVADCGFGAISGPLSGAAA